MSDDLSTKLTAGFGGTQVEQGLVKLGATAKNAGRDIAQAGQGAGKAFGSVGTGAEDGNKRAERATKSLIDSIQRTTVAANAGAKGTADYYREIARIRDVSLVDCQHWIWLVLWLNLYHRWLLDDFGRRLHGLGWAVQSDRNSWQLGWHCSLDRS